MFEKNGHYFADWRNRRGQRQRKSFTSEAEAIRHQEEMRAQAHPKQQGKGRRSQRSCAPISRKRSTKPRTPAGSQRLSARRRAVKGLRSSRRIRSLKRSRATKD